MTDITKLARCPFCQTKVDWCKGEDFETDHECHHLVCENGHYFDLAGNYNPETLEELRTYCVAVFSTRPLEYQAKAEQREKDIEIVSMLGRKIDMDGSYPVERREAAVSTCQTIIETIRESKDD